MKLSKLKKMIEVVEQKHAELAKKGYELNAETPGDIPIVGIDNCPLYMSLEQSSWMSYTGCTPSGGALYNINGMVRIITQDEIDVATRTLEIVEDK